MKKINLLQFTDVREYLKPTIEIAIAKIEELFNKGYNGYIEVFNYVEEIMRNSQPVIEKMLDEKLKKREIKDKNQSRKSIAGNNFQSLIVWLLKINQEAENIPKNIVISKTKDNKIIKEHAIIRIGEETQKPDVDLIIHDDKTLIIYSCKTSLRERAGQTYKWKLLFDINENCPTLVEKYKLQYPKGMKVLTGFITPNFYNEINQPQQRGMIKFFDYAYIGKKIKSDFIKPLSKIIEDLNTIFAK